MVLLRIDRGRGSVEKQLQQRYVYKIPNYTMDYGGIRLAAEPLVG